MKRKKFEEMKKRHQNFIDEFVSLCEKHNLALQSDDPYCGLKVVPYDKNMKEYYSNPDSFGRWDWQYIEKNLFD